MSFGDAMQRRANILRKRGADMDKTFIEISKGATVKYVDAATEKTPPNTGAVGGTNTQSGELKSHWAADSVTVPQVYRYASDGNEYETLGQNNVQYASYVDQGHRMDKHFVPGLIIDPVTNRLEKVSPDVGGIMVGTKTQYVPGVFMSEAGRDAYEEFALKEMNRLLREVFKP